VWLIWPMVCLLAAPWVKLSVSAGSGWPHNALWNHWLMPISCHFPDCKAPQVTSLTHVSGAVHLYLQAYCESRNYDTQYAWQRDMIGNKLYFDCFGLDIYLGIRVNNSYSVQNHFTHYNFLLYFSSSCRALRLREMSKNCQCSSQGQGEGHVPRPRPRNLASRTKRVEA